MTWVVAANSNTCCIYLFNNKPLTLNLIKEISHQEFRLKKSEYLTSDKPGRYQTDGTTGGAYSPHTDPKDVEIDNFSREIALVLNQGRNSDEYDKLIIIMPPEIIGAFFQHINPHVKNLIKKEIQKNLMHLSQHELLDYLHKEL